MAKTLQIIVLACGVSVQGLAAEFQFFEHSINYWKAPEPAIPTPAISAEAKKETFDWSKHMDPKNKEFFREGDYVPPEPFMEIVRNPTDHNLKMWFAYIEKKNALAERLSRRMAEYSQAHVPAVPDQGPSIPVADADFKRYRFRLYFESTCPHCQSMFQTLNDLHQHGYYVEARQIDEGPTDHIRSEVPILKASSEEVKRFHIEAVPLLLIGDLMKKTVYRQSGFMTAAEVLSQLSTPGQRK